MPEPKPLTQAKILEHLMVAMNRAIRKRDVLYFKHKGNVNRPDYIRAKTLEQAMYRVHLLANGYVEDWNSFVNETLGDNTDA